jgi:hypothetical protein
MVSAVAVIVQSMLPKLPSVRQHPSLNRRKEVRNQDPGRGRWGEQIFHSFFAFVQGAVRLLSHCLPLFVVRHQGTSAEVSSFWVIFQTMKAVRIPIEIYITSGILFPSDALASATPLGLEI